MVRAKRNVTDMTHDLTYTAHQITATSAELPVTLEIARMHLRNEDLRVDDSLVRGLIRSSERSIEQQYGLALLEQTVVQTHNAFPASSDTPMLLRIAPLLSVTTIVYIDAAGATQTWSAAEYISGKFNNTAFVIPKSGFSWPTGLASLPNAVTITYEAGFGASAEAVPDQIRQAMLLNIGWLYENREDPTSTMARASENLLRPYYRFSV